MEAIESRLQPMLSRIDITSKFLHKNLLGLSATESFRARILVGVCLVQFVFVPFVFLGVMGNFGSNVLLNVLGYLFHWICPVVGLLLLKFTGRYKTAAAIFTISTALGLVYFAVLEHVPVSGTYFWFAGQGIFCIYLFGTKIGKYCCALILAVQVGLIQYYSVYGGILPIGLNRQEFIGMFMNDVTSVTLAIWSLAALYELRRSRFEKDLTEAQTELLKHQDKLMKGARLTELGQMAGGVAHEINNPLAIVHAYNIRLRRELEAILPLTEEQKTMFSNIERSCLRISTISRSLLSYAHEGAFEQDVVFTLAQLQDEFMVLCSERMRRRNIDLELISPSLQASISGKYVKLLQIIVNLLNNAIDAVSDCQEKWIQLEILLEGNELHIAVIDSGEGVPAHLRELIKSPFFTTKPVGKGTGLGLSIVDGIIREVNGQFYLDSSSPHTRFVIRFPIEIV